MMKKIFGMATISALAFSMFACSGEDGADGISGKDGKDGADGVSCTVKALKDDSGFKVLCDGDSVGVLKNGTDGKAGKDGKDGKDGEDGEDGADGSEKSGTDGKDGKNGTSCTAKAVTDGFKIICGTDTVGVLKNGDDGEDGDPGEAGESCTLTEGENGLVTVTCGEKTTNLFKAVCNYTRSAPEAVPYDPETQLCYYKYLKVDGKDVYENFALPKCADQSVRGSSYTGDRSNTVYDPTDYTCKNGVLVQECKLKDKDGNDSLVAGFVAKTMYCDKSANKVVDKVPCSKGNTDFYALQGQYCYRKTGDALTTMQYADSSVCGTKKYSPVTHFCYSQEGSILKEMDICAKNKATADKFNIDIRYTEFVSVDNNEGFLCDTRDYQVYKTKTTTDGEQTWMIEDLRYAYLNPTYGYDANPKGGLDSSSFCRNDDCRKGRFYLWSAAIDSAALTELVPPVYCGMDQHNEACTEKLAAGPIQGVCPEGWHLPNGTNDEKYTFNGEQYQFTSGHYMTSTNEWYDGWYNTWAAQSAAAGTAYYLYNYYNSSTGTNSSGLGSSDPKNVAIPVRCIKNPPKEETP